MKINQGKKSAKIDNAKNVTIKRYVLVMRKRNVKDISDDVINFN